METKKIGLFNNQIITLIITIIGTLIVSCLAFLSVNFFSVGKIAAQEAKALAITANKKGLELEFLIGKIQYKNEYIADKITEMQGTVESIFVEIEQLNKSILKLKYQSKQENKGGF
jgi:peptidoglycan hydrolase CwlO-like protein